MDLTAREGEDRARRGPRLPRQRAFDPFQGVGGPSQRPVHVDQVADEFLVVVRIAGRIVRVPDQREVGRLGRLEIGLPPVGRRDLDLGLQRPVGSGKTPRRLPVGLDGVVVPGPLEVGPRELEMGFLAVFRILEQRSVERRGPFEYPVPVQRSRQQHPLLRRQGRRADVEVDSRFQRRLVVLPPLQQAPQRGRVVPQQGAPGLGLTGVDPVVDTQRDPIGRAVGQRHPKTRRESGWQAVEPFDGCLVPAHLDRGARRVKRRHRAENAARVDPLELGPGAVPVALHLGDPSTQVGEVVALEERGVRAVGLVQERGGARVVTGFDGLQSARHPRGLERQRDQGWGQDHHRGSCIIGDHSMRERGP